MDATPGHREPLAVTRLLLTPICHVAPPDGPCDVVRVSVGTVTAYLMPAEAEGVDEAGLRALLGDGAAGAP